MVYSIRYQFTQNFSISARKAFNWCTDYDPRDHALMGEANAKRQITHLTGNTIILTETFQTSSGSVEKQKLVQLYPDRLSWISTHIAGPNKYSQFIYEISSKTPKASRLKFTALHLEYEKSPLSEADVKSLERKLQKEDVDVWKLLAKAMEEQLRS